MLNYEQIKNRPRILSSLTGLTPAAFEQLAKSFNRAYQQELAHSDNQREQPRQRQRGGGRKGTLASNEDKLLFVLFYFKLYPIQELLGFFFGLSQAQANYWIHYLTPMLNQALGYEQQLPARKSRDIEQVLAACPELEFILDGTERPIQRPKDCQRQ